MNYKIVNNNTNIDEQTQYKFNEFLKEYSQNLGMILPKHKNTPELEVSISKVGIDEFELTYSLNMKRSFAFVSTRGSDLIEMVGILSDKFKRVILRAQEKRQENC